MIRHIPDVGTGHTYCGRSVSKVCCIRIGRDCIEAAECRSCQRSNDRRVRESLDRQRIAKATEIVLCRNEARAAQDPRIARAFLAIADAASRQFDVGSVSKKYRATATKILASSKER